MDEHRGALERGNPHGAETQIDYDDRHFLYTRGRRRRKGVPQLHLNFYMVLLSALANLKVHGEGVSSEHSLTTWRHVWHRSSPGRLYVMEYAPDPVEILKLTQEEKITYWIWPPALYLYLPMVPDFESYDLSSLRMCIVFGALAPPAVLDRWRKLLPDAEFMNYYGQTEMSPLGACLQNHDMAKRPDSIGRSHLPLELKVFGPEGREVPRGETGELVARGLPSCWAITGRRKRRPIPSERWHHTGDMVRMDHEGFILLRRPGEGHHQDGGENVSSQEVEATRSSTPRWPTPPSSHARRRWSEIVTAVIVPRPGQTLDEKEVIDFCKASWRATRSRKSHLTDALPRNPSGKILKNIFGKRSRRHNGHDSPASRIDRQPRAAAGVGMDRS
jgi:fatty-acyl-CoA synthase